MHPPVVSVAQYYSYVVAAGKSLAGNIENAEFIISVGEFERYLDKRGYLAVAEKSSKYKHYRESPFYNGALGRVIFLVGREREGDCFVLRKAPLDSFDGIVIRCDFTVIHTTPYGLDKLFAYIGKLNPKLSAKDYRNVSDIILEFYGANTGNTEIADFLNTALVRKQIPKVSGIGRGIAGALKLLQKSPKELNGNS